jgi:hypothetical protein
METMSIAYLSQSQIRKEVPDITEFVKRHYGMTISTFLQEFRRQLYEKFITLCTPEKFVHFLVKGHEIHFSPQDDDVLFFKIVTVGYSPEKIMFLESENRYYDGFVCSQLQHKNFLHKKKELPIESQFIRLPRENKKHAFYLWIR